MTANQFMEFVELFGWKKETYQSALNTREYWYKITVGNNEPVWLRKSIEEDNYHYFSQTEREKANLFKRKVDII